MDKDLKEKLELFLIDDDTRMFALIQVWRELTLRQLKLLEDIGIFFKWYHGSKNERCPYSKESLNQLAEDILHGFSTADSDFIKKHRYDYEVLEIVCRGGQMSSLYIIEVIKLMDYLVDHDPI